METVRRIFVEKKPGFAVEAEGIYSDLKHHLGITGLTEVRVLHRYDISGISEAEFNASLRTIFSEPPVDVVYLEQFVVPAGAKVFAMEYLPGQYDQRADWAAQSVQILTQKERPEIRTAKVLVLEGQLSETDLTKIKEYCINPVEAREALLQKPASLVVPATMPEDVAVLDGFNNLPQAALTQFLQERGLAMSLEDLVFCQAYFRDAEKRDPTITEIKVIDTYWSDHCRHTTFHTKIGQVEIEAGHYSQPITKAWEEYRKARNYVYGEKAAQRDINLMDIATTAMKELKKQGHLPDLDESEEINACSIVVQANIDGQAEDWLVMFKNETHNHPTEIEPFGGAATCLGGCIRDPLSGRAYAYQAMRVTGSADPRVPLECTLPGKLSQRKITTSAAAGYSSYGNQIGLATGQVAEVYHEGYVAKRMEIGAVMAAVPKHQVVREAPEPGDIVLLVGGRTGRDGCGGATGSSKAHTEESLETCGAEVQKGNPPTERKIQRLFRHSAVSTMIKRCNDFGAGGVSVAIGELTDGLQINLDAVPKKYEGLDGTELAISESQERMAVVVAADNAQKFIEYADAENLEATLVAKVSDDNRLTMLWRGKAIVSLSRDFLNTNGAKQHTNVRVTAPVSNSYFAGTPIGGDVTAQNSKDVWLKTLQNINVGSQKGLVERFDSSIGAGTVLMPFGGKYQATPAEGMVAKLPVVSGDTTTGTIMTYGFNPHLSSWSPFHGAVYAIVEAVAKVVALGGNFRTVRLTLQEYFEKLGQDNVKWGKPFSALLGAFYAQQQLGIPAIGGKDSMSGSFNELTVPPTLVAFAVTPVDIRQVISQEFKQAGSQVAVIRLRRDKADLPDFAALGVTYDKVRELAQTGKICSAYTIKAGGIAEAVSKMAFGNRIGIEFVKQVAVQDLFTPDYGSLVLELPAGLDLTQVFGNIEYQLLGQTTQSPVININGVTITLEEAFAAWEQPLEKVFPTRPELISGQPQNFAAYTERNKQRPRVAIAKPRVLIPVFPGTNCEYDTIKIFEQAGAIAESLVIRNLSGTHIEESITALARGIAGAQIIMLPGGFSAGDEPDGSGKFIATMFRNPRVKEAVAELLQRRDGLMLGICNGFQALIKLGLVPYGEIQDLTEHSPTLTFNKIGRHISCMVNTKVVSTLSPWLSNVEAGEIFAIPASHGEGRFYATAEEIAQLAANGQIATQYVDSDGLATYDASFNPNGSFHAIESITSPDGRILGKMAHSERIGDHVAINIPGSKDQRLFSAGVNYFK
ncbi:Phosphoribosylformylglycinamidine synthase 2 [Sporomusa ovata DSM 2662]|uniref:Phosphoribosylformylglycinamidine synthase, synthetase subunit / Phosphoribosylformylglycinamidine synthase, glutamine amidotransferase subunit n=1 Tax=Sporomusa ovata TaxID=2378 RepID=A0A0U1L0M7_9FIRM|nr:phosphoribosylformylglycinamidine synthase [Sporomusa ovata DSM 2662]CQR72889.1 Phosphoribosylformylglycinamidine synthase, synthetase subunit / Phosphoribosylformylglycinamidine synthase, glutamine amidotransferase subunit [Sporomusa ovata]